MNEYIYNKYNKYMDEKHAELNAKLKPCPFCGRGASVWSDKVRTALKKVECDGCGIGTLWEDCNVNLIVEKWNTRVELKEE